MTYKKLRVAFDCDETLWINGNYGNGGRPNEEVVLLFRALQRLGCWMIIWSAGGKEWAQKVADYCYLIPDQVMDKPELDGKKYCDFAVDYCEDLGTITLFV